jgi:uncharacterized membrane protein
MRTFVVAAALLSVASAVAAQNPPGLNNHIGDWTIFDAPGAGPGGTVGVAINDVGQIIGVFYDASGTQHGFVRSAEGVITTVDPGGSQLTFPEFINIWGVIVGEYIDAAGNTHGFLRSSTGVITSFDEPNAGGSPLYTEGRAINDAGAVVGNYNDAAGNTHCFLRSPGGSWTTIDGPGADGFTTCGHINSAGELAGKFLDVKGVYPICQWHPD